MEEDRITAEPVFASRASVMKRETTIISPGAGCFRVREVIYFLIVAIIFTLLFVFLIAYAFNRTAMGQFYTCLVVLFIDLVLFVFLFYAFYRHGWVTRKRVTS